MLLNDSIIRTRFREGFDHEVMMEPGTPYKVRDRAPADEQPVRRRPPDPHRHLLVELPPARAQPEHRRADRAAHPHGRRRADGVLRRGASLEGGAAGDPGMTEVDAGRLRDLTLELVEVESPTGDTAEVARLYADAAASRSAWTSRCSTSVFPETPTVIGRLRGDRPGPTVVLNGHLDVVPIPHDPPAARGRPDLRPRLGRHEGRLRLRGRGRSRAERERVVRGRARDRRDRPARGARRARRGSHLAPRPSTASRPTWPSSASCRGPAWSSSRTWARRRRRSRSRGRACRRTSCRRRTARRTRCSPRRRWSTRSRARSEELAADEHPWVGAETYFVGELHGGDFYNRFPSTCRIVGHAALGARATRSRPSRREYRALLDARRRRDGLHDRARPEARPRRRTRSSSTTRCSLALQEAYREVTGEELEPVGIKVVADGALFAAAGIPTVYHGPVGAGAHADVEYMSVARARAGAERLRRAARGGSWCDRPGPMPSRELGERYPNLLAIGGHPAVDMPPHVVEAAAQAAGGPPYAPTHGLRDAARGDRGAARRRARASDRSRPGGARHARRDAGPLPRRAGLRRARRSRTRRRSSSRRSSRRPAAAAPRRAAPTARPTGTAFAAAIDAETTLAIVNTPVNPTGYVFRPHDLDAIAAALARQRRAAALRRGVRRRPLRRPRAPLAGVASGARRADARPAELLEDARDGGVARRLRRRPAPT